MPASRTLTLAAAVAASLFVTDQAHAVRSSSYTNTSTQTNSFIQSNTTSNANVNVNQSTNTYTHNGAQTKTYSVTVTKPDYAVQPVTTVNYAISNYSDYAQPCNGNGQNCAPQTFDAVELVGLVDATAMNNKGDVVGQISGLLTSDRRAHAGMWTNGSASDLGMVGCRFSIGICYSKALGVNNNGAAVGTSHVPSPYGSPYYGYWSVYYSHEAMFENGQATPLRTVGWEYGSAEDITNNGTVVGHGRSTDWINANGDYLVHGFVIDGDTIHEIGTYGQSSRAFASNEQKVVTGEIMFDGNYRAFQWEDQTLSLLGHLGGFNSRGKDIANSNDAIVGESYNDQGRARAALWKGNDLVDLGTLASDVTSSATAINESGQIVGVSGSTAVMWQHGAVVDLNGQVTMPAGVRLMHAIDINDKGQVLVKGSNDKFYLLTPRTNGDGPNRAQAQPN